MGFQSHREAQGSKSHDTVRITKSIQSAPDESLK